MSVSKDDVRHIAALARLGLEQERIESLARDLNSILEHMKELASADTSSVADDEVSARGQMPLRADDGSQLELLRRREEFAPSMRDSFFMVPRLATHEEEVGE